MRSPVEYAHHEATIAEVAVRMGDATIGFMPVCDDDGRVLGVVTDRDIAVRTFTYEEGRLGDLPIARIMTPELVSCRPDDPVERAEALMRKHRVERVVVVDEHRRPLGVISLADLSQVDELETARTLRIVVSREVAPPPIVARPAPAHARRRTART
jgi:CBS domain-containing protein